VASVVIGYADHGNRLPSESAAVGSEKRTCATVKVNGARQYSSGVQHPCRPVTTSSDQDRLMTWSDDRYRPSCHSFTPRRSTRVQSSTPAWIQAFA
jgi:hypothetical protein